MIRRLKLTPSFKFVGLRSIIFVVICCGCSACAMFGQASARPIEQVVYYATTRAPASSAESLEYYGSKRGELDLGIALVKLPADTNPKSFAKTFDFSGVSPLTTAGNSPAHILQPRSKRLAWVAPVKQPEFLAKIDQALVDKNEKRLLFYIHGFKRNFGENLESGARLAYEMAYPGPTVVFSWPSTNSLSGYIADRGNADWSTPYLIQTLMDIHHQFPSYKIDLVAHSMGSRVLINLLLAFQQAQLEGASWPFAQVVMLAPDVDRALFVESYAGKLNGLLSHFTVYVSDDDFPLMASGTFNAYPRLGDSRSGVPVVAGMETVDVSNAITMASGHAYYRKSHAVSHDLYLLLNKRLPARERETLKASENASGVFWQVIAQSEEE